MNLKKNEMESPYYNDLNRKPFTNFLYKLGEVVPRPNRAIMSSNSKYSLAARKKWLEECIKLMPSVHDLLLELKPSNSTRGVTLNDFVMEQWSNFMVNHIDGFSIATETPSPLPQGKSGSEFDFFANLGIAGANGVSCPNFSASEEHLLALTNRSVLIMLVLGPHYLPPVTVLPPEITDRDLVVYQYILALKIILLSELTLTEDLEAVGLNRYEALGLTGLMAYNTTRDRIMRVYPSIAESDIANALGPEDLDYGAFLKENISRAIPIRNILSTELDMELVEKYLKGAPVPEDDESQEKLEIEIKSKLVWAARDMIKANKQFDYFSAWESICVVSTD
jgi:hypothetical protein